MSEQPSPTVPTPAPAPPDLAAEVTALRQARAAWLLEARLAQAGLPEPAAALLRQRFQGRLFAAEDLDREIADLRQVLAAVAQPSGSGIRPIDEQASVKSGTSSGSRSPSTGCTVPTSWLAVWRATTPTSGAAAASTRSPTRTRPSRVTPTSQDLAPHATACRTAECSTAGCTTTSPRREPRTSPSSPRCTAWVPVGVKVTSSGRTPRASAVASRALSSRRRAVRPARCSRRGSAYPWSRAARSTSRAAGWSGTADALSRYPSPGTAPVTGATYATTPASHAR